MFDLSVCFFGVQAGAKLSLLASTTFFLCAQHVMASPVPEYSAASIETNAVYGERTPPPSPPRAKQLTTARGVCLLNIVLQSLSNTHTNTFFLVVQRPAFGLDKSTCLPMNGNSHAHTLLHGVEAVGTHTYAHMCVWRAGTNGT